MAKKREIQVVAERNVCRDCANVTIETKFRTLSVTGEPTLGRCPYYKESKFCVLLSQKICEHFKKR